MHTIERCHVTGEDTNFLTICEILETSGDGRGSKVSIVDAAHRILEMGRS